MSGIKVTREGPATPLPSDLEVSGDEDGDQVDWDTGPGVGPGGAGGGHFELADEGGAPETYDNGALGSTATIDPSNGNAQDGTVDDDVTITLDSSTGEAGSLTLWLTWDGDGHTVTWDGVAQEFGSPDATDGTTSIAVLEWRDSGATYVVAWPGAGGSSVAALDDLTDVTITAPASADRLRYDGSGWVNSNLVWEPMIATDGTVQTDGLLNPQMHEVAY